MLTRINKIYLTDKLRYRLRIKTTSVPLDFPIKNKTSIIVTTIEYSKFFGLHWRKLKAYHVYGKSTVKSNVKEAKKFVKSNNLIQLSNLNNVLFSLKQEKSKGA